ncbi:MAG: amidohydrolase [Devosia sp.]|nr:amidohydrolase [Devosia sp.]
MAFDTPAEYWLTGLRFADGNGGDLLVRDGNIAALAAASGDAPRQAMGGWLCLPSFVEGHVHLDKTFLGTPWQPHLPGGSVADRIRQEKVARSAINVPVEVRGSNLVEQELRFGTGYMRSHVDIDAESRLANFEAVSEIRQRYADRIDIQIVAFPQSGILASPGTEAFLDAALAAGADAIGGLDPAGIDGDPVGHLDVVFSLASRRGKDVDIHLHEGAALGVFELDLICDRTERFGLGGRVTVSHSYCLAQIGPEELKRIGGRLASAGVAILTSAPQVSMPPVRTLRALGVNIFAGSDNIRDAWSPFGNGDMLERAQIAARQQDLVEDADLSVALDMVGGASARALRLPHYGIAIGAPADLVLVEAETAAEAVASVPRRRMTFKRGRKVAELGGGPA